MIDTSLEDIDVDVTDVILKIPFQAFMLFCDFFDCFLEMS